MTQSKALELAKVMRSGSELSESVFARLLSEVEGLVQIELHKNTDWKDEGQLEVPHPFDRIYWIYIIAMVDLITGDLDSYKVTRALYDEAFRDYANFCMRERSVS